MLASIEILNVLSGSSSVPVMCGNDECNEWGKCC